MAGKALKASGKQVIKYSRDGAVARDLAESSETRISGRTENTESHILVLDRNKTEVFEKLSHGDGYADQYAFVLIGKTAKQVHICRAKSSSQRFCYPLSLLFLSHSYGHSPDLVFQRQILCK